MLDFSDPHRFRKTLAGLCMVLAPVLFLAASIISPGLDREAAEQARIVSADGDAYATATVLTLLGWSCFLVAVLGIAHMLRERGVGEGHLGGALAVLGTLAAIVQTGFALAVWQAAQADTGFATTLLTNVEDSALAAAIVYYVPLAVTLGGIVLAWALYRHRFVPAWMAAALGASAVLFAPAAILASQALFIATSAVLLAGLGALGSMVLRESVDDWQHTPTFHGLRPAGTH